jgi:hypothetical protein
MGNRCNNCNKFVGLDLAEGADVESIDVSGDEEGITVELSVRFARVCAECGDDLREGTAEVTHTISVADLIAEESKIKPFVGVNGKLVDDIEWSIEEGDVEVEEGGKGKDRQAVAHVEVKLTATLLDDDDEEVEAHFEDTIDVSLSFAEMEEVG